MDTNEHELFCRDEVFEIVGCAMDVQNSIGHGFHEKPYENALAVELAARGIEFEKQKSFSILHRDREVGTFVPDLVVFGKVIVDLKSIKRITEVERGQMLNYLRVTDLKVGLIINFSNPKLEWERLVL